MFKTKRNIVLALAVCALLLPMTLTAKDQVTRPFKIWGNITLVLDLGTMTWVMEDWGEATYFGRYANQGSGTAEDIYLQDADGSGTKTVANGDEEWWDAESVEGVMTITITGGTGRFEGATGSFIMVPGPMDVTIDYVTMTITYTFTYTGSGTITY